MANSIIPNQIGFIPSGVKDDGNYQSSSLVFGINQTGGWQSIGFGPNGQPDALQILKINISNPTNSKPTSTPIVINISASDISSIFSNPNAPATFNLILKEVAICESAVEKRMVILASQTYLP